MPGLRFSHFTVSSIGENTTPWNSHPHMDCQITHPAVLCPPGSLTHTHCSAQKPGESSRWLILHLISRHPPQLSLGFQAPFCQSMVQNAPFSHLYLPLFFSGEKWFHRSLHPEQDADQTDPTHLQQDQQVYLWLPEHRGRIRHWQLPRN